MEWRKELGWGFHGQISSARFTGCSRKKKSVGTFDATFDMPLTFGLNVGFTDAFVLNLSTELPIFASARSPGFQEEALFIYLFIYIHSKKDL